MFTDIKIRSIYINTLEISWSLDLSEYEDISNFHIQISRSESPLSGFFVVENISIDSSNFIDVTVDTRSKNRVIYYKLKLIDTDTGDELSDSGAKMITPASDVIAIDVIRRERLLLREYTRVKCYFYIARTFGMKCHYCYDPIRKRKTEDNCPECMGTGFQGGFFDPISGYIDISPDSVDNQVTGFGPVHVNQSHAWTTNFPLLKSNDYIFEVDNGKRWRIIKVSRTEKSRFILKQLFNIVEENRSSNIYNIQLPEEWIEPW